MPRIRRRFLLDPAEIGVYHCINRCVRRAYLCGRLNMRLQARPIEALGRANRGMPRSDELDNMELCRLHGQTDP